MKFTDLAMACIVASGLPGAVIAADCSAAANIAIAKNLTANWRMLKIDVSSDSCIQSGCYGIVAATVTERLPKSSDVNSYQFSFPYEISKGSSKASSLNTRRFGADMTAKPVLSPSVSSVSCANH
jgi:hypothetical protein